MYHAIPARGRTARRLRRAHNAQAKRPFGSAARRGCDKT